MGGVRKGGTEVVVMEVVQAPNYNKKRENEFKHFAQVYRKKKWLRIKIQSPF
jgi:hypothetical protein